jgi:hypothetical protein
MFGLGSEAVALSRCARLNALHRIIPRDKVKQILDQRTAGHSFCARVPAVFMVYFVLAMGLFSCDSYRQVFRWLAPWKKGRTPGRSTLCEARHRVGTAVFVTLAGQVVKLLATPGTAGAFYRGLRLMTLDGFVVDLADTPANEKVFGRPQGGRSPGAFPQARLVSLCEAGTHVMWRWLIKPIATAEQTMADYLLRFLEPGMLLMWDCNFLSHDRVAQALAREAQLLIRVRKGLVFQPIRNLPDGSYLARLYRNAADRKQDRGGIRVRVIDYTLDDPRRTGDGQPHRLITTLLDDKRDPARTLIELYHVRWEQELAIDELKTHESERPVLRSQSPAGVVQELYGLLLDHFVIRCLMFDAAAVAQVPPLSISFTGAIKILRCRIPDCPRAAVDLRRWWRDLVAEVAEDVLPPRANRINPRVIKRKMSKWEKKQPRHRLSPQPTKPFVETIVMLH